MSQLDQADRDLVNAAHEWGIDHDRDRADRVLREALFVHRQAIEAVRESVRVFARC